MYLHESFRHRRRRRIKVSFVISLIALVGLISVACAFARVVSAAEPDETVIAAAERAGIDPVLLEGALVTVGEPDPVRYLRHAGHLPWPVVQPTIPTVWLRLVQCEASGNWRAVSPGGRYRGGIQADQTFWARYGGLSFAPSAHLATPEQQIVVAQRGLAVQGWQAWPVCSRVIGAR